jgi:tetratricopeptide (TPR) repeat protein
MATYQPLADAFKPLLPLTKKEVLDKYGSVLVKVIPELKRKGYEPAPKLDEVGEKVRLFEQVTGWLKEVSEVTPIVICIEDLHWADFATLELMNACIREIKNSPIMILGTFRDDEVEPTSIIFQTVEEEITELMKLSTLNQEDVQSLIKGMLGRIELSEDFIGHLYTATAGNAFFVSEVMRALIEEEQLQLERGRWFLPIDISALELPTSIEATILRRLKVLNSDALNFAQISSIVGRDLDLFMLKELSGMDDEKLFRLLDELIGHQFIKKEEKLYAFTHDQVREILYKRIDEKKRKQLHEKAGCYLEQRYADDINAISSLLAHHFCAGLDIEKAARYSFITGMILSEKQSLVESCTHLKKAISIWEQDKAILKNEELLERAKETLAKSSLFNELNVTVELCEDLLSKLRKTPYLLTVVRLMKIMMSLINFMPAKLSLKIKFLMMKGRKKKQETEWFPREKKPARFPDYGSILQRILVFNSYLALAYGFIGSYQRSLQIIEESIEKYLPDYETPFKASLLTAQLLPNAHMGKYRKLIEVSEEAYLLLEKYCEYAKDSGPDMERQFWWGFGNLCSMQIQNFAILGKKCPDPKYEKKLTMIMENWNFQDVYFLYKCGEAIRNVYCGKHKEFLKAKEIISTLNKKMGKLALNEIWIHMWQAFLYLERGEFKNVLEFCKKAISMSETIYKAKYYIVCSIIYKSVAMFEMGEQEEAVSLLESILKECYERNLDVRVPALYYLGDFYIKLSKIPEAEAKYEEAHRICCSDEYWCDYYQINTYRRVGEIAIKKRDFERALQYLEKSIKMATDDNNPIQQGFTSLALSELYSQLGQFTKAFNVLKIAEGKFLAIDNTYQISRVKELRKQIMSKRGNF